MSRYAKVQTRPRFKLVDEKGNTVEFTQKFKKARRIKRKAKGRIVKKIKKETADLDDAINSDIKNITQDVSKLGEKKSKSLLEKYSFIKVMIKRSNEILTQMAKGYENNVGVDQFLDIYPGVLKKIIQMIRLGEDLDNVGPIIEPYITGFIRISRGYESPTLEDYVSYWMLLTLNKTLALTDDEIVKIMTDPATSVELYVDTLKSRFPYLEVKYDKVHVKPEEAVEYLDEEEEGEEIVDPNQIKLRKFAKKLLAKRGLSKLLNLPGIDDKLLERFIPSSSELAKMFVLEGKIAVPNKKSLMGMLERFIIRAYGVLHDQRNPTKMAFGGFPKDKALVYGYMLFLYYTFRNRVTIPNLYTEIYNKVGQPYTAEILKGFSKIKYHETVRDLEKQGVL
jgi:hypothetical protein